MEKNVKKKKKFEMAFVLSQKPPTKGAGLRSFRPGSLGEGRGFVSQKEKQKQAEMERMNRVYYEVWSITKGYQHVLVVAGPEKVTRDEMRRVIANGLDLDVNKVMELRVFIHPDSGRVERVFGVKFDGRHEGLEEALRAGYVESERGEVLRIRRYYMPVDPSVAARELCIRQARGVEEKEVRKVIEAKIGGLQEGDQLFQRGQEWFLRAATVPRAKKLEGMQFEWGAVGVHVRLEPVPLSMKRSGRSWTEVVRNAAAEPVEQGGQVDKRDEQEKEEVDDGGKMNMKISPEIQPKIAKNGAKAATAQKPRGQDPKPGPAKEKAGAGAAKEKAGAGASAELAAMQEKCKEMEVKVEVLSKQIQGIQEGIMEATERTLVQWMESMSKQMSKQMELVMAAVTAAKGNDGEEARARGQQVQLRVQEEENRVREQQEDEARAQAKQLEREEEARLQREQEARANAQREQEARAIAQREEEVRLRREQEARANAQREQEVGVQADEQKRQEEEKARQKELQLGDGMDKKGLYGKKPRSPGGKKKTDSVKSGTTGATEEDPPVEKGAVKKKGKVELQRPAWIPSNLGATRVEAYFVTLKEGAKVKERKAEQKAGDWWIAGSTFGREIWTMTTGHAQNMLWVSRIESAHVRDDDVLAIDMMKATVTEDGLYCAMEKLKMDEDQKDISAMEVDDGVELFLAIKAGDLTDVSLFRNICRFISDHGEAARHD